jgi:hypothetical protein
VLTQKDEHGRERGVWQPWQVETEAEEDLEGRVGRRGPQSKIDTEPEIVEKILLILRAGNYFEVAAAVVGVSRRSLYRWMEQREDFREKVQQAIAISEMKALKRIQDAADAGVWQAAAWKLERRFPERWARRDRPEVPDDQVTPSGVVILPSIRPIEDEVETQPMHQEEPKPPVKH